MAAGPWAIKNYMGCEKALGSWPISDVSRCLFLNFPCWDISIYLPLGDRGFFSSKCHYISILNPKSPRQIALFTERAYYVVQL